MRKEVVSLTHIVVIDMKILILILLMVSKISIAQMLDSNNNELKDKVLNKNGLTNFIQNDFVLLKDSKSEELAKKYYLFIKRFNRSIKNENNINFLFGLQVEQIFAYQKNENEGAIYLLMDINYQNLKSFVNILGIPENTTVEDYEKGDFEIAMWRWKDLEISILHSFIPNKSKDSRVVTISNVSGKMDLINLIPQ